MATPADLRTHAYTAVAVASIAYQSEVATLTHVLACAHRRHGLTVAELCDASGLDEPFITRLLQEAHH